MSSNPEDADTPPPAPSRRITWMLNLGLLVGAIVAGIAWHRAQDPARRWVTRVEQGHAQHMDRPPPAVLRHHRSRGDSSAGRRPAPRSDDGAAQRLPPRPGGGAPGVAQRLRGVLAEPPRGGDLAAGPRAQRALPAHRSYRILEQSLAEAQGQPNDQQRERIAQRIESLSAEIAAEQRALSDLLTAARDAASPL